MSQRLCRSTLLALLVAGAPVLAAAPPRPALPSVQANRAQAALAQATADLHLGAASFLPRTVLTTREGRTVARYDQLHAGHRVWGAQALVHLEAQGATKAFTQGVQAEVALSDRKSVV